MDNSLSFMAFGIPSERGVELHNRIAMPIMNKLQDAIQSAEEEADAAGEERIRVNFNASDILAPGLDVVNALEDNDEIRYGMFCVGMAWEKISLIINNPMMAMLSQFDGSPFPIADVGEA